MKKNISPEVIDQIIFAMENQEDEFIFDLESGMLKSVQIEETEPESENRYLEIPSWTSADGFQLMEEFTATLRNPIVRENLRNSLSSGRGVFRKFKNVLKETPEVERRWFLFKEKAMRKRVVHWYNEQCELIGYEKIGPEPDETDELILSDFVFIGSDNGRIDLMKTKDREAFSEIYQELPSDLIETIYLRTRIRPFVAADDQNLVICAETPSGDFAGFAYGDVENDTTLCIRQLYVMPEYRGLGLGSNLLNRICQEAYGREFLHLLIQVPGGQTGLWRVLETTGFRPLIREMYLNLESWGKENRRE